MPVGKLASYRLVFAEEVADFVFELPKGRQRKVLGLARQLLDNHSVRSDYEVPDDAGRPLSHLLIEDYLFVYWLDHAAKELRIVDMEDVS